MKKRALWIILTLAAIVVVGGGLAASQALGRGQAKAPDDQITVEKGDVIVSVIETGSLEAVRDVEVKSRVGGRVARLLVDEGDMVQAGQLIAIIDPQETELQVKQNRAQLRGAEANVRRLDVDIAQRRITAANAVAKAESRVRTLEAELKAQPQLTSAAVRTSEASLTAARKQHDLLVNVTLPNARTQAENAVADAQNNQRQARVERDRQKELFELGYVSRQNLEQAELSLQLADTRLRQASESLRRLNEEQRLQREASAQTIRQAEEELNRSRINTIQNSTKREEYRTALADLRDARAALRDVDGLRENRASAAATVDQLSSGLADAERQLGETAIRAPISGIVTQRLVQVGELVSSLSSFSSGTPIVKIEDRSSMLVKLQINEIDVARLQPNMTAKVQVDAFPELTFAGVVSKIAPARAEAAQGATDQVVRYAVEVRLDDVDPKLKSGMSAKCTVEPVARRGVVRIPISYLGTDKDGTFAMKPAATPAGKPTRIPIEVGIRTGSFVEVTSGLNVGDKIVKPPFTGPARAGFIQMGPGDDDEEAAQAEGGEGGGSSQSSQSSESSQAQNDSGRQSGGQGGDSN